MSPLDPNSPLSDLAGIERAQRYARARYRSLLTQDDLQCVALAYLEAARAGKPPLLAIQTAVLSVKRLIQRRAGGPVKTSMPASFVEVPESGTGSERPRDLEDGTYEESPEARYESLEIWSRLPTHLWPLAKLWAQGRTDAEVGKAVGMSVSTVCRRRRECQRALGAEWDPRPPKNVAQSTPTDDE